MKFSFFLLLFWLTSGARAEMVLNVHVIGGSELKEIEVVLKKEDRSEEWFDGSNDYQIRSISKAGKILESRSVGFVDRVVMSKCGKEEKCRKKFSHKELSICLQDLKDVQKVQFLKEGRVIKEKLYDNE